ncbi:MAG: hypothetical protein AAGA33_03360 [Pseudomonadota bacterium]
MTMIAAVVPADRAVTFRDETRSSMPGDVAWQIPRPSPREG